MTSCCHIRSFERGLGWKKTIRKPNNEDSYCSATFCQFICCWRWDHFVCFYIFYQLFYFILFVYALTKLFVLCCLRVIISIIISIILQDSICKARDVCVLVLDSTWWSQCWLGRLKFTLQVHHVDIWKSCKNSDNS